MELHFYPGQHALVVKNKNSADQRFSAWGGPSSKGSDPRMPEEPTWPGTYVIHSAGPYRTPTWAMSKLKWGTRLRDMPASNDVWYEVSSGKWASIKKDAGIERFTIVAEYYKLYGQMRVPDKWVFNDFGPLAIRWFKDLNGNRKLDGKEVLSGQMFHTTPGNEAEHAQGKPVNLTSSHGCIHLNPSDRDRLMSMGAFAPGTVFVVHGYHEKP